MLIDQSNHPNRICIAPDVERLELGDEDFLYSADMQALFSLNPTGAYIWRLCESDKPLDKVIGDTARKYQLSSDAARGFVISAWEEWARLGLLQGSQRLEGRSEDGLLPKSAVGKPGCRKDVRQSPAHRHYAVLDTLFEITCQTAAQAECVFAVVGHLEIPADLRDHHAPLPIQIQIVEEDGVQEIFSDGHLVQRCDTIAEIAPLIHWQVFSAAVNSDSNVLQLHTAAVTHEGQALLLPGPSGAGKSTLSAALLEQGFGYLSDDMVVLDRDNCRVRGLPFSLCVKESGLAMLHPDVPSASLHLRADGLKVHYRHPAPESLVTEPQMANWVVFPRYAPDTSDELRPISPAEALRRLFSLSAQPRQLSRHTAKAILDWASDLKCCELEYTNTRFAVDSIRHFCGQRVARR